MVRRVTPLRLAGAIAVLGACNAILGNEKGEFDGTVGDSGMSGTAGAKAGSSGKGGGKAGSSGAAGSAGRGNGGAMAGGTAGRGGSDATGGSDSAGGSDGTGGSSGGDGGTGGGKGGKGGRGGRAGAGGSAAEGGAGEGGLGGAGDGGTTVGGTSGSGTSGGGTGGSPLGDGDICEQCGVSNPCKAGYHCVSLPGLSVTTCAPDNVGGICPDDFHVLDATSCTPDLYGTCCIDPDGDGYGVGYTCDGGDCDEVSGNATSVHDGAPELCNTIDDDCVGGVDNDPASTMCLRTYPSAANVATWACNTGDCAITGCASGKVDVNSSIADGCECGVDSYGGTCGTATAVAVSRPASGFVVTGQLPANGQEDWLKVTFSSPGAVHTSYNPQITLTAASGILMDVLSVTSCPPPAAGTCGTSGFGAAITSWSRNYTYSGSPTGPWTDTVPRDGGSVMVRVFLTGSPPALTCTARTYTLTFNNP